MTEPVFLPFLISSSAQKWKTKIYKSEYRAGNIAQRFCRAIKLCIISVKIYLAIMVKVKFEIKVKKRFYRPPGRVLFFAIRVIGNENLFKVGLIQMYRCTLIQNTK